MIKHLGHHTGQEMSAGAVTNDLMKPAVFLGPSLSVAYANELIHVFYRVHQGHTFVLGHMETRVPGGNDLNGFEQTENFDYRLGFDGGNPSTKERLNFHVTIGL